MKKVNTLDAEQIKELTNWLQSEIEKLNQDISRYNETGNYSKADRAEGARDAYYKCISELTN